MAQRISAVVNITQTPEEVADSLGVSVDDLIDYGNGYALVETQPEAKVSAPVSKPKAKPEADKDEAPEAVEE